MAFKTSFIVLIVFHLQYPLTTNGSQFDDSKVDVKEFHSFQPAPLTFISSRKPAYNHLEFRGVDETGERVHYSFHNQNNRRTPFGSFHHHQMFPMHYAQQQHHNYEHEHEHSGYEPHYEDHQNEDQQESQGYQPMRMMNQDHYEHSGHMPFDDFMQNGNSQMGGYDDYGNSRYGGGYVRRRQHIPQGEDEGGDIDAGGGFFQLSEHGGEVDISSSNYTGTHFHMGGGEFNVIRDPWRHHSMFANLFNSHIGSHMPQQPIHELHQHFTYVHNDQNEHHHTHINKADDVINKDNEDDKKQDNDERRAIGRSQFHIDDNQRDSQSIMNLTHESVEHKEYGGYKRGHLNKEEVREGHDAFASGDPEQMENFFGNVDQAMREETGITNENPPQIGKGVPVIGNNTKDISKYLNRPYNSNGDYHNIRQPLAPLGIVMRKRRSITNKVKTETYKQSKRKLYLQSLLARLAKKTKYTHRSMIK